MRRILTACIGVAALALGAGAGLAADEPMAAEVAQDEVPRSGSAATRRISPFMLTT